ncbi:MAG: TIGR03619 family F420-dependent LLM class oxidoreductase [Alphaproteobacteria bacterium]|nr:TIGR03619 family F420-dependent LLM class oxidoreductase [Alphaproteobacteria bacterium]
MQFGCLLPTLGAAATRDHMTSFAMRMEEIGFDALFVSDHVVVPWEIRPVYKGTKDGKFPWSPTDNVLEPLAALAFVAAVTKRVKLGTSVLVLPNRHPILVAKLLSTIDHLSGGRVVMAAGVGWMEEEITLMGNPFHRRGAWANEAIRLMRTLWMEERAAFDGTFFKVPPVGFAPKPVNKTIPIWIGGYSDGSFRRVAALGDGWHASNVTFESLEKGIATIKDECRKIGRRFEDLTFSIRARMSFHPTDTTSKVMFVGDRDQIITNLKRLKTMGVSLVLFEPQYPKYEEWVNAHEELATKVMPHVR